MWYILQVVADTYQEVDQGAQWHHRVMAQIRSLVWYSFACYINSVCSPPAFLYVAKMMLRFYFHVVSTLVLLSFLLITWNTDFVSYPGTLQYENLRLMDRFVNLLMFIKLICCELFSKCLLLVHCNHLIHEIYICCTFYVIWFCLLQYFVLYRWW